MKFLTSCCMSDCLLQDAYVDANTGEVVSKFDEYACDNDECANYGGRCGLVVEA